MTLTSIAHVPTCSLQRSHHCTDIPHMESQRQSETGQGRVNYTLKAIHISPTLLEENEVAPGPTDDRASRTLGFGSSDIELEGRRETGVSSQEMKPEMPEAMAHTFQQESLLVRGRGTGWRGTAQAQERWQKTRHCVCSLTNREKVASDSWKTDPTPKDSSVFGA